MIKLFPPSALVVIARVLEGIIAHIDERFDLEIYQVIVLFIIIVKDKRFFFHFDPCPDVRIGYVPALGHIVLIPAAGVKNKRDACLRVAR